MQSKGKHSKAKHSAAAAREVAGGGRAIEVSPERMRRWFERFTQRNDGVVSTRLDAREVTVVGGNATTARIAVPFEPLTLDVSGAGEHPGLVVEPLIGHMSRRRRIGLLLVRLGGHSVGVADGGEVVASRTDRRLVHGRNSAGGWSQQRFARRREEQARDALRAAGADAADVLGSRVSELDAVVLGGDRRALEELRTDSRLEPIFALAEPRVLDVAEPRRTVLDEAARRARCAEIVLHDAEVQ